MTRSALVEQAYALQQHEIDSQEKYRNVFALDKTFSWNKSTISSLDVNRILVHHAKLMTSTKAVPSQLVSALRNVCPSDSLRTLLRAVMTHKAMDDDAEGCLVETLVANVCRMACTDNDTSDNVLNGLLIASLSILTGSILCTEEDEKEGSLKKTGSTTRGEYIDTVLPALQVGSALSLLQCKDGTSSSFHLDEEILEYLGKASAVYEERIEIQKSRLERNETPVEIPPVEEGAEPSPIPIVPLTPTNNDEERQETEVPSPAEHGDEEFGSDSDSTDDSEERFNRNAMAGLVPHGMDEDDEDIHEDESSESSSDSEGDPQHVELVEEEDDDDDDDDGLDDEDESDIEDDEDSDIIEEEDDILREALALSLADQGPAFEAVQEAETSENANNDEHQQEEAARGEESDSTRSVENILATTDATEARMSSSAEEEDESSLPPMPPAPSHYPYAALLTTLSDADEAMISSAKKERSVYLDPSELSRFGSIPSSHALVHLLRYLTLAIQQRRKENEVDEDTIRSTPGGMGSTLFDPRLHPVARDVKDERNEDSENSVTLLLLMSTFLVLDQNRRHAIENLRHAIAAEQRNLQGEDESDDEDDSPLSAEDDPALALAMNYVEDDVYLEEDVPSDIAQSRRSESLESKGMRRKAAAAAHDSAARLKSLRKQIEAWRNRVKLLSQCTLMSMKCLREYLRATVSLWLQRSASLYPNHRPRSLISTNSCHQL